MPPGDDPLANVRRPPTGAASLVRFFLKLAATLLLLWVTLRQTDLGSVAQALQRLDWEVVAAAVAIHLLMALLASVRWYYVLLAIGHPLPFLLTWRLVMISTLFNQVLPSALGGDVLRVPYAHYHGVPLGGALNAVVLDRLVSLVALVLLTASCLPLAVQMVTASAPRTLLILVTATGLGAALLLTALPRLPKPLAGSTALKPLMAVARGLRATLSGRYAAHILLSSLAVHLLRVLIVYITARNLALDVTALQCLVLVPPAMLVTVLPVSIGGWGLREGAFVVAFGFVGVPAAQALVLSVVFGATMLLAALAGIVPWLGVAGKRGAVRG